MAPENYFVASRFERFRPQQSALFGGFILMLSSGLHMNYGFFDWESVTVPWIKHSPSQTIAITAAAWFFGGIVGFAIAPSFLNFLSKKIVYFVANFLVGIAGIFLISAPSFAFTVLSARFFAGIGHGLAYVAVVQHFGEVCDDNIRGRLGTALHLFILKGGMISGPVVINFFSVEGRMDVNRFLGLQSLGFSIAAAVLTVLFYKESPVTLIKAGKDEEALRTLMILRGEIELDQAILEKFDETKAAVLEGKMKSSWIFAEGNVGPLVIVILLRLSFVLSFNTTLKHLHSELLHSSSPDFDFTFIMNSMHTFVTFFVLFTIDSGRRIHFILSAFGTSISLIFLGIITASSDFIILLFLVFESFSAIGLGLTAHIYSTEAFHLSKKTKSIAVTSIIENCLQISLVFAHAEIPSSFEYCFFISSGVCLIIILIYLFFKLPETKNESIQRAQKKFE